MCALKSFIVYEYISKYLFKQNIIILYYNLYNFNLFFVFYFHLHLKILNLDSKYISSVRKFLPYPEVMSKKQQGESCHLLSPQDR